MTKQQIIDDMKKQLDALEKDNSELVQFSTENVEWYNGYLDGAMNILKIYIGLLEKE